MTAIKKTIDRTSSAAHITLPDPPALCPQVQCLEPTEPPNHTLPPAERDAIFVALRELIKVIGPKPNKHDLAKVLIQACVSEGFDTRSRIVGALTKLGLQRGHIVITLNENSGTDPTHYLWSLSPSGRYCLHPLPVPAPPGIGG